MLHRISLWALLSASLFLATGMAHAYLLNDYFGVNPTLTEITDWNYGSGTYSGYMFTPGSLDPTQHLNTVDYQTDDWFGQWGSTIGQYTSYPGTGAYPSGEEPYDTEAYYFDNDASNVYFAMIVGCPSPTSGIYQETRAGIPVTQGDFAIDTGQTGSQTDSWGFNYNYGVDLTDENRPASADTNVSTFASNTVGNQVYNTTSGWYLGTPYGAVNPVTGNESNSFTNFDPSYDAGAGMTATGTATVNWYQLALPHQENNWDTYVIEITIPLSALGDLGPGDTLRYHWLMGCRNDGSDAEAYMTGSGDVDTPEPGTVALLLTGLAPLGLWVRRRRKGEPQT